MRRMATLVLIWAAVIVTAASALAGSSPKTVRDQIVAAALAQSSVHWTWSVANLHSEWRTADVSAGSAIERMTFRDLGRRAGTAEILRVGRTEYERADAAGLRTTLDLSGAQAKCYAGQWIWIPQGDPGYTNLGLTLSSIVQDATPQGTLTVTTRKSHGTRLLVLKGRTPEQVPLRSTLLAHAGSRLPVSYLGGARDVWINSHFSKWNEPVHVHAPASSTPIATVRRR